MRGMASNTVFILNGSIIASPRVNNYYILYYSDRIKKIKIDCQLWESLKQYFQVHSSIDLSAINSLLSSCSIQSVDDSSLSSLDDLICEQVLIPYREGLPIDPQLNEPNKNNSNIESNSSPSTLKVKRPLFSVRLFNLEGTSFDDWLSGIGPQIIDIQRKSLYIVLSLYFFLLYIFFFSTNSLGADLEPSLISISGTSRIIIALLGVNFLSVTTSMIASYALGINDSSLYIKLIWGCIPKFAHTSQFNKIKRNASTQRLAIYTAQPLLTRVYVSIILILIVLLRRADLQTTFGAMLPLILTILQASIASILILLIPFRLSPGYRLLNQCGIFPDGYLQTCLSRFQKLIVHIFTFRFNRKLIAWPLVTSYLFVLLLLVAITFKVSVVGIIVIPKLIAEIPYALGTSSKPLVQIILLGLLANYLRIKILPKFLSHKELETGQEVFAKKLTRNFSDDNYSPRATSGKQTALLKPSSNQEYNTSTFAKFASKVSSLIEDLFKALIQKKIIGIPVIFYLCLMFIPYNSTAAGTASITQTREISIIASIPSKVEEVVFSNPSSTVIKKDKILMKLSSIELNLKINSFKSELADKRSERQQLKIRAKSLNTGSSFLKSLTRTDLTQKSELELIKLTKELSHMTKKKSILNEQLRRIENLESEGAISTMQLQEYQLELLTLNQSLEQLTQTIEQEKINISLNRQQEIIEQKEQIEENIMEINSQLQALDDVIPKMEQNLLDLLTQKEKLTIYMPYDGYVITDPRGLEQQRFSEGDTILKIRSYPLTQIKALLPEYMRSKVKVGQPSYLRFYAYPTRTYSAMVISINPSTVINDSLSYLELFLKTDKSIPDLTVGSNGNIKIITGRTCLLFSFLKPFVRFFMVDVWSWLP